MISHAEVDALAERKPVAGSPVLSVYLDLDQSKASHLNRGFETKVEDMLRAIESGLDEAQSESFRADAGRVRRYIAGLEPRGKAAIVFADDSEDFLWAREVHATARDNARWGDAPYIVPLLAILDEYERYGVALVDKAQARLFTVFIGEIEEQTELLASAPVAHTKASGTDHMLSENRFQSKADMHVHLHLKQVAETLEKLAELRGFDRLLLAGPIEATSELERLLPKRLQSRIVERLSVPLKASTGEVLKEVLRVEGELERRIEKQLVDDLLAGGDGHHPFRHGLEPTVRAACEERIWQLIYADGFSPGGGQCSNCGMLFSRRDGSCDYCGAALKPVDDLLERIVERVLEQDGKIEEVEGEAADRLQKIGGIGAFLRF